MQILESAEDYLESILQLSKEKGYVRSVDIAARLGYSKPSVSIAMKRLRENGYITMDDESLISLTDKGMEIASRVNERHWMLTRALMILGVPQDIALQDACRMEHDISDQSFEAIKKHLLGAQEQTNS